MNELALFAGAGGGILGGKLLGWRTVCAVERDAYAAEILAQRQNDGILPPFPIWSDVCSFDGRPWNGIVDVVSGGFPCQDISSAGTGAGISGKRSGLWSEFARIIGEVRPRYAFIENSPMLVIRGLDRVLCDLASMGFDAKWGIVSAADTGAPHLRERIWIVAHANGMRELQQTRGEQKQRNGPCELPDVTRNRHWSGRKERNICEENGRQGRALLSIPAFPNGWTSEPPLVRGIHGVANRVDRIKALGNGQVPRVAAAAFTILSSEFLTPVGQGN